MNENCSKTKGRAPVFWRADYAASATLPVKYHNVNLRGHLWGEGYLWNAT